MRATLMHGAGAVRVEDVPASVLSEPSDALVWITAACICGTDLWPYASMPAGSGPARMGHEFVGIVEDTGSEVTTVTNGDFVVVPWFVSDGTCEFCREGQYTACVHGGMWGQGSYEGGQAEAVRGPFADTLLGRLPVAPDSALMPSLLTLSDVLGTGYHAAFSGGVTTGSTVTVIGDG